MLVTSGLGGHFPFGYPVGTITSVNHNVGERFADIEVKPAAHLDRSNLVLLVWTLQPKINKKIKNKIFTKKLKGKRA
jgi:rod shape-determining protein MreC